ncbi:MAG TPA: hypothetical protein VFH99_00080 [Candidatus Saccharimonadales bacterium]|nr:hypothetical protein [Candidatus Saccharimonadales bacterium]
MKPDVAEAVEEIKQMFTDAHVLVREDGQGGAYVIVETVDPGKQYVQRETWVGFYITFQYPYSDVYPHFVRGDLKRKDGKQLGEGATAGSFEGRPAIQLSRKSNRLNPATDTALLKLTKVIDWLRTR